MAAPEVRIRVETPRGPVTGAWTDPPEAAAVLVIAHGAGNDMHAPLLAGCSRALNARGVATMRFNFPYTEAGRRGPDTEGVLRDAWAAVFEDATGRAGGRSVFAGGKSLGGRIASLCVADGMPAGGLVFLGYPLHPPGKPDRIRDEHLYRIEVPMLFLEGTRDPFATPALLERVLARLGPRAEVDWIDGGDHSFRVRGAKREDRDIGAALAPVIAAFLRAHA
jgi:hypothetical protein